MRQRAARYEPGDVQAVQTEQLIQPLLHGVPWAVTDGLVQRDLMKGAGCMEGEDRVTLWWQPERERECESE